MITITIEVNGISRTYKGDYDTMHSKEWADDVREMIDSQVSEERNHAQDDSQT
jgi:hypothetical protein